MQILASCAASVERRHVLLDAMLGALVICDRMVVVCHMYSNRASVATGRERVASSASFHSAGTQKMLKGSVLQVSLS